MPVKPGRDKGQGTPHVEVLDARRLPAATPAESAPPERDAHGRFLPGNRTARASRLRPRITGLAHIDQSAPDFRTFARWGLRYGAHRRRELAELHGGTLSAGASAIIESAAQAMAASRFLQWRASQTGDPSLFAQAARLAQTARQNELAAWELASREAQARGTPTGTAPWLLAEDHADDLPNVLDDLSDAQAQEGPKEGQQ